MKVWQLYLLLNNTRVKGVNFRESQEQEARDACLRYNEASIENGFPTRCIALLEDL